MGRNDGRDGECHNDINMDFVESDPPPLLAPPASRQLPSMALASSASARERQRSHSVEIQRMQSSIEMLQKQQNLIVGGHELRRQHEGLLHDSSFSLYGIEGSRVREAVLEDALTDVQATACENEHRSMVSARNARAGLLEALRSPSMERAPSTTRSLGERLRRLESREPSVERFGTLGSRNPSMERFAHMRSRDSSVERFASQGSLHHRALGSRNPSMERFAHMRSRDPSVERFASQGSLHHRAVPSMMQTSPFYTASAASLTPMSTAFLGMSSSGAVPPLRPVTAAIRPTLIPGPMPQHMRAVGSVSSMGSVPIIGSTSMLAGPMTMPMVSSLMVAPAMTPSVGSFTAPMMYGASPATPQETPRLMEPSNRCSVAPVSAVLTSSRRSVVGPPGADVQLATLGDQTVVQRANRRSVAPVAAVLTPRRPSVVAPPDAHLQLVPCGDQTVVQRANRRSVAPVSAVQTSSRRSVVAPASANLHVVPYEGGPVAAQAPGQGSAVCLPGTTLQLVSDSQGTIAVQTNFVQAPRQGSAVVIPDTNLELVMYEGGAVAVQPRTEFPIADGNLQLVSHGDGSAAVQIPNIGVAVALPGTNLELVSDPDGAVAVRTFAVEAPVRGSAVVALSGTNLQVVPYQNGTVAVQTNQGSAGVALGTHLQIVPYGEDGGIAVQTVAVPTPSQGTAAFIPGTNLQLVSYGGGLVAVQPRNQDSAVALAGMGTQFVSYGEGSSAVQTPSQGSAVALPGTNLELVSHGGGAMAVQTIAVQMPNHGSSAALAGTNLQLVPSVDGNVDIEMRSQGIAVALPGTQLQLVPHADGTFAVQSATVQTPSQGCAVPIPDTNLQLVSCGGGAVAVQPYRECVAFALGTNMQLVSYGEGSAVVQTPDPGLAVALPGTNLELVSYGNGAVAMQTTAVEPPKQGSAVALPGTNLQLVSYGDGAVAVQTRIMQKSDSAVNLQLVPCGDGAVALKTVTVQTPKQGTAVPIPGTNLELASYGGGAVAVQQCKQDSAVPSTGTIANLVSSGGGSAVVQTPKRGTVVALPGTNLELVSYGDGAVAVQTTAVQTFTEALTVALPGTNLQIGVSESGDMEVQTRITDCAVAVPGTNLQMVPCGDGSVSLQTSVVPIPSPGSAVAIPDTNLQLVSYGGGTVAVQPVQQGSMDSLPGTNLELVSYGNGSAAVQAPKRGTVVALPGTNLELVSCGDGAVAVQTIAVQTQNQGSAVTLPGTNLEVVTSTDGAVAVQARNQGPPQDANQQLVPFDATANIQDNSRHSIAQPAFLGAAAPESCVSCGSQLTHQSTFCRKCGTRREQEVSSTMVLPQPPMQQPMEQAMQASSKQIEPSSCSASTQSLSATPSLLALACGGSAVAPSVQPQQQPPPPPTGIPGALQFLPGSHARLHEATRSVSVDRRPLRQPSPAPSQKFEWPSLLPGPPRYGAAGMTSPMVSPIGQSFSASSFPIGSPVSSGWPLVSASKRIQATLKLGAALQSAVLRRKSAGFWKVASNKSGVPAEALLTYMESLDRERQVAEARLRRRMAGPEGVADSLAAEAIVEGRSAAVAERLLRTLLGLRTLHSCVRAKERAAQRSALAGLFLYNRRGAPVRPGQQDYELAPEATKRVSIPEEIGARPAGFKLAAEIGHEETQRFAKAPIDTSSIEAPVPRHSVPAPIEGTSEEAPAPRHSIPVPRSSVPAPRHSIPVPRGLAHAQAPSSAAVNGGSGEEVDDQPPASTNQPTARASMQQLQLMEARRSSVQQQQQVRASDQQPQAQPSLPRPKMRAAAQRATFAGTAAPTGDVRKTGRRQTLQAPTRDAALTSLANQFPELCEPSGASAAPTGDVRKVERRQTLQAPTRDAALTSLASQYPELCEPSGQAQRPAPVASQSHDDESSGEEWQDGQEESNQNCRTNLAAASLEQAQALFPQSRNSLPMAPDVMLPPADKRRASLEEQLQAKLEVVKKEQRYSEILHISDSYMAPTVPHRATVVPLPPAPSPLPDDGPLLMNVRASELQDVEQLRRAYEAMQLDEQDLDEDERAALAEVASKGYYHGRPASQATPAPQLLKRASASANGGPDSSSARRTGIDEFQHKWDKFDRDSFVGGSEEGPLQAAEKTVRSSTSCPGRQSRSDQGSHSNGQANGQAERLPSPAARPTVFGPSASPRHSVQPQPEPLRHRSGPEVHDQGTAPAAASATTPATATIQGRQSLPMRPTMVPAGFQVPAAAPRQSAASQESLREQRRSRSATAQSMRSVAFSGVDAEFEYFAEEQSCSSSSIADPYDGKSEYWSDEKRNTIINFEAYRDDDLADLRRQHGGDNDRNPDQTETCGVDGFGEGVPGGVQGSSPSNRRGTYVSRTASSWASMGFPSAEPRMSDASGLGGHSDEEEEEEDNSQKQSNFSNMGQSPSQERLRSQSVPMVPQQSIGQQFSAQQVGRRSSAAAQALGVKKGAGKKTITTAFRQGARVMHPDKGGDKDDFQVLNEAFQKLLASDGQRMAS